MQDLEVAYPQQLLELLAEGGFGRVYAIGGTPQEQQPLVLKVQDLAADPSISAVTDAFNFCYKEYKVAAKAWRQQHPALSGALSAFVALDRETEGPLFCMVMGRVNGQNICSLLKVGR